MTALAADARDRRGYRQEVERLLERIRDDVHGILVLRASGARGPALAERKRALRQVREELEALVASPR
jgi:hypothetical protein